MAVYGPWHIDIRPWAGVKATSGTWVRDLVATHIGGGRYDNSSSATGDYAAWDVNLAAGTWTLTLVHQTNTSVGDSAMAVTLGGTSIGTINGAISTANNYVTQITGISVAADGPLELRLTASAAKRLFLQHIALSRTA